MVSKLYVVLDKVANESGPVFQAKNDGIALRSYFQLLKDVTNKEDYKLLCIGVWDNEELELNSNMEPREVLQLQEVEE